MRINPFNYITNKGFTSELFNKINIQRLTREIHIVNNYKNPLGCYMVLINYVEEKDKKVTRRMKSLYLFRTSGILTPVTFNNSVMYLTHTCVTGFDIRKNGYVDLGSQISNLQDMFNPWNIYTRDLFSKVDEDIKANDLDVVDPRYYNMAHFEAITKTMPGEHEFMLYNSNTVFRGEHFMDEFTRVFFWSENDRAPLYTLREKSLTNSIATIDNSLYLYNIISDIPLKLFNVFEKSFLNSIEIQWDSKLGFNFPKIDPCKFSYSEKLKYDLQDIYKIINAIGKNMTAHHDSIRIMVYLTNLHGFVTVYFDKGNIASYGTIIKLQECLSRLMVQLESDIYKDLIADVYFEKQFSL